MSAAILATVTRSGRTESVHRGDLAVVDSRGRLVAAAGRPERVCYFRSAAKLIQMLPAIDAGACARYGLAERELAVMASSHTAAPRHLEAVRDILAAAGLEPRHLGCGHQPPRNRESRARLEAGAPPSPLYNNCSGKHAGMLLLSQLVKAPLEGYLEPGHPAQRLIIERVADYAGLTGTSFELGTDGCSAPTLYAPLEHMARAYARLAVESREKQSAAALVTTAMARRADMLGEKGTFQVTLEEVLGGRLAGKYGAEGLFCVALVKEGLGVAVRIEDGAERALPPVLIDVLLQLGVTRAVELGDLARYREPVLRNWRGLEIGSIGSTVVLSDKGR